MTLLHTGADMDSDTENDSRLRGRTLASWSIKQLSCT